jgi:hypothetical protein
VSVVVEKQMHLLFDQALNSALKESLGQIQLPSASAIKASWETVYLRLNQELKQPSMN